MQFDPLRRRDFITLLVGAMALPLAARAQQGPAAVDLAGRFQSAAAEFGGESR
jgi:hypothetical protein